MDLTFQFMAYQTEHSADNESGRLNRGSIINIYNRANVTEPPNPNGRLMFIHCLDAPFNSLEETQYLLEPVYDQKEILHRKRWLGDYSKIVENFPNSYQELSETKETNMNWDDIKSLLVNIETGVYHG